MSTRTETLTETRNRRVNLRLNDIEYSAIAKAAGGLDVGTWIRELALDATTGALDTRLSAGQHDLLANQDAMASALAALRSEVVQLGASLAEVAAIASRVAPAPHPTHDRALANLASEFKALAAASASTDKLMAQRLALVIAKLS